MKDSITASYDHRNESFMTAYSSVWQSLHIVLNKNRIGNPKFDERAQASVYIGDGFHVIQFEKKFSVDGFKVSFPGFSITDQEYYDMFIKEGSNMFVEHNTTYYSG